MKFRTKLALMSFLIGCLVLLSTMYFLIKVSEKREINQVLFNMQNMALSHTKFINNLLISETGVTKTLAQSPSIINALIASNSSLSSLSEDSRVKKIETLNKQWLSIKEKNSPFIHQYLHNNIANILKSHQLTFPNVYGEIFITNKYGALVAATGHLTTFSHAQKYWWLAAYNNGNERIFFDDRGYDKSVKGYVIGVVVPIHYQGQFLGIIKSNIFLEKSLKQIVSSHNLRQGQKMSIIRSGGLIIIDEANEPLKAKLPEYFKRHISGRKSGTMYHEDDGDLLAFSPVNLTLGNDKYGFGGKHESIDHLLGNKGESWMVVMSDNASSALGNFYDYQQKVFINGLFLLFLIALTVLFLTKLLTKPLVTLAESMKSVGKGNLDVQIDVKTQDEIGEISSVFNQMINRLKTSTISIECLSEEVEKRKKKELELIESEEKFRALFEQAGGYCMVLDPNTSDGIPVIIDANKAACAMHGYTYKEFIGRPVADIENEDGKSLVKKRTAEIMTGKLFYVENEHVRKDGSTFFVAVNAKRIDIGDKPSLILTTEYDISEHKKSALELKASESRFRGVFEQAAVGVARLAPDGSWLEVNDKLCDIVEYTHEELLTRTYQDITHPDDLQIDLGYINQLLEDKIKTYSMEKRYITKNGDIVWINLTASLVRDINNKPDYFISIIEDITELKKAEAITTKAFSLLKTAEKLAHIGSWEWDIVKDKLTVSDEWRQIHGVINKNLTATELMPVTHPDDAKAIEMSLKKALDGVRPYDITHRIIRENTGEVRTIHAKGVVSRDNKGKAYRIIGTSQDITERKLSEDKIRKISLAVEQSPESIIITNTNAEIEYINQSFLQASGYSREEIIGQNPRILQSGKTPKETYKNLWSTLTAGETWKGILQNRNKDGKEYTEHAIITPLRQPDGTVSHYVAIKEDITEKNRIAKELEQHRHHLENLVESRTKELVATQKQAETANQAKSSFLANMSHEIRTPMNAILGLTHLLRKTELNSSQSEQLQKIGSEGEHLLSVINDILDLSKIEAGKIELEHTNFNLETLFDNIQLLLAQQFKEKGLLLEIEPLNIFPWLIGDPTRLRQALINYLSNALKFTSDGKVTLRVKLLTDQDYTLLLRFEVQDTGMGIESDKLKEVFKNFEQADSSTTRQFGGTGLGLSITKRLARLMSGDVGVESEINQGSTFWFSGWFHRGQEGLSLSNSLSDEELENTLSNQYADSHILLVEDNEINLEVAQGILTDVGLVVDTATNGLEALEKIETTRYALVLMDVQMPKMDGLEATRRIRAIADNANLPILAMTAGVLDNEKQDCITAGMNDFVAKPIELNNFYSSLIKWLP